MKISHDEIRGILEPFGLTCESVTRFYDTSHSEDDKRLNYILDDRYVLKVNSVGAMVKWLGEEARRAKCAALIRALVEKPL